MSHLYDCLKNRMKQQEKTYESPEDHLNLMEKLALKEKQEKAEDYIDPLDKLGLKKAEPTSDRYQALKKAKALGDAQEEVRLQREELHKQEVKVQFNELIEQPVMKGLAEHKRSITIKLKPELSKDLYTYYQQYVERQYLVEYLVIYIDLDILSPEYTHFIDDIYFGEFGEPDALTISIKYRN